MTTAGCPTDGAGCWARAGEAAAMKDAAVRSASPVRMPITNAPRDTELRGRMRNEKSPGRAAGALFRQLVLPKRLRRRLAAEVHALVGRAADGRARVRRAVVLDLERPARVDRHVIAGLRRTRGVVRV